MIGSVNATLPDWNIVDDSATKAAMANFAKSVSKEFGPKGIRVNTVSPRVGHGRLHHSGGGR
jgi:NAD(P)-dependent dehydrogenase (short-subunit alcohol dehydrogenase family)